MEPWEQAEAAAKKTANPYLYRLFMAAACEWGPYDNNMPSMSRRNIKITPINRTLLDLIEAIDEE